MRIGASVAQLLAVSSVPMGLRISVAFLLRRLFMTFFRSGYQALDHVLLGQRFDLLFVETKHRGQKFARMFTK